VNLSNMPHSVLSPARLVNANRGSKGRLPTAVYSSSNRDLMSGVPHKTALEYANREQRFNVTETAASRWQH